MVVVVVVAVVDVTVAAGGNHCCNFAIDIAVVVDNEIAAVVVENGEVAEYSGNCHYDLLHQIVGNIAQEEENLDMMMMMNKEEN